MTPASLVKVVSTGVQALLRRTRTGAAATSEVNVPSGFAITVSVSERAANTSTGRPCVFAANAAEAASGASEMMGADGTVTAAVARGAGPVVTSTATTPAQTDTANPAVANRDTND